MLNEGATKYLLGTYIISPETIKSVQFFRRKYHKKPLRFKSNLRGVVKNLVKWGDVFLNSHELLTFEKDLLEVKRFLEEQDRYQHRCYKGFRHYLWTMDHIRVFHELNKFSSTQDKRFVYIRQLKARVTESSTFLEKFSKPQPQRGTQEHLKKELGIGDDFW